jgi:Undecaprenyl-phosphate galactose phosphotransferase WbaP
VRQSVLPVRQSRLLTWEGRLKRLVDILLALGGGLALLPVGLAIALAIRLDSPGGALYGHRRIGREGREFTVWKFRTMVQEAEAVLAATLAENPAVRREWEAARKLKADPRVTRFGRMLRRTSLDELPQLWNVLRGEMSLVGPRPIVAEEIRRYGEGFQLYTQVRPGLSGLWQVSGRNNLDYAQRVRLDGYYIRNWSAWLDIEILLQTLWALVRGEGAY